MPYKGLLSRSDSDISVSCLQNSTQNVTAVPGQLLTQQFKVKTGEKSGTHILVLYISTKGANFTYYLPAIVLGPASAVTTIMPQLPQFQQGISYGKYLPYLGVSIIAIILLYLMKKKNESQKYDMHRSVKLQRIKKRIEISEQ